MSSGKRSSYELTTNTAVDDERPHSFYDNLTTSSSSGSRVIQIPDIQFKFDDDIPVTSDPRRSTLMSNAKSDFFGLSKGADTVDPGYTLRTADETKNLLDDEGRRTPPATIVPPASSSSPTSTASTAPARSSAGSPDDASPEQHKPRPVSAHRSITIKLPDAGTPSEVRMRHSLPVFREPRDHHFEPRANDWLLERYEKTLKVMNNARRLEQSVAASAFPRQPLLLIITFWECYLD